MILHYRDTLTQGVGSSPAELLMSCRTKTLLPATNQLLQPFAPTWKFEHRTISPGNIQANSKVESAVKTAKQLLQKACKAGTDPYLVILHYRDTLTQGVGSSPAELLMSCRTKTLLPATNQLLQPQPSSTSEQRKKLVQRQIKQKLDYDRHAKDLQPLSKGDTVCVKPF